MCPSGVAAVRREQKETTQNKLWGCATSGRSPPNQFKPDLSLQREKESERERERGSARAK